VPNVPNLNRKQKLDIILRGINIDNVEFTHLNTILTKAVQIFILETKRFTSNENQD
jgi:uncharacterized membrane protein YhfC